MVLSVNSRDAALCRIYIIFSLAPVDGIVVARSSREAPFEVAKGEYSRLARDSKITIRQFYHITSGTNSQPDVYLVTVYQDHGIECF